MTEARPICIRLPIVGFIAFLLLSCSPHTASEKLNAARMSEANQLYEAGEYAEAATRYEALVDADVHHGQLYYNLGNAYFRLGDIGRAVLNFRRAQSLLPRDDDVAANLRLTRAQVVDPFANLSEGPRAGLIDDITRYATADEIAIAALILWAVTCGLLISAIVWQQRRRPLLYASLGIAALLVIGILLYGLKSLQDTRAPPAVMMASETAFRSGPGDDYLIEFTLHAGMEARIIERRNDWVRIALPGNLQGWLTRDTLLELFP
jgi:tetratricopeptide (TPR) repeat protein